MTNNIRDTIYFSQFITTICMHEFSGQKNFYEIAQSHKIINRTILDVCKVFDNVQYDFLDVIKSIMELGYEITYIEYDDNDIEYVLEFYPKNHKCSYILVYDHYEFTLNIYKR